MNKTLSRVMQGMVIMIGFAVLVFLLWEPWVEGVNAGASWREVYLDDPFLVYVYVGSLAFFWMLYLIYRLIGCLVDTGVRDPHVLILIQSIRRWAVVFGLVIALPVVYLVIVRPGDDIAGGVAMGTAVMILCGAVVCGTVLLERRLKSNR